MNTKTESSQEATKVPLKDRILIGKIIERELDEVVKTLAVLREDAGYAHFAHASMRFDRAHDLLRRTRHSLRVQLSKMRGQIEPTAGVCKVCGCTEADCSGCVKRTGQRCHWTDDTRTLCSACAPKSRGARPKTPL